MKKSIKYLTFLTMAATLNVFATLSDESTGLMKLANQETSFNLFLQAGSAYFCENGLENSGNMHSVFASIDNSKMPDKEKYMKAEKKYQGNWLKQMNSAARAMTKIDSEKIIDVLNKVKERLGELKSGKYTLPPTIGQNINNMILTLDAMKTVVTAGSSFAPIWLTWTAMTNPQIDRENYESINDAQKLLEFLSKNREQSQFKNDNFIDTVVGFAQVMTNCFEFEESLNKKSCLCCCSLGTVTNIAALLAGFGVVAGVTHSTFDTTKNVYQLTNGSCAVTPATTGANVVLNTQTVGSCIQDGISIINQNNSIFKNGSHLISNFTAFKDAIQSTFQSCSGGYTQAYNNDRSNFVNLFWGTVAGLFMGNDENSLETLLKNTEQSLVNVFVMPFNGAFNSNKTTDNVDFKTMTGLGNFVKDSIQNFGLNFDAMTQLNTTSPDPSGDLGITGSCFTDELLFANVQGNINLTQIVNSILFPQYATVTYPNFNFVDRSTTQTNPILSAATKCGANYAKALTMVNETASFIRNQSLVRMNMQKSPEALKLFLSVSLALEELKSFVGYAYPVMSNSDYFYVDTSANKMFLFDSAANPINISSWCNFTQDLDQFYFSNHVMEQSAKFIQVTCCQTNACSEYPIEFNFGSQQGLTFDLLTQATAQDLCQVANYAQSNLNSLYHSGDGVHYGFTKGLANGDVYSGWISSKILNASATPGFGIPNNTACLTTCATPTAQFAYYTVPELSNTTHVFSGGGLNPKASSLPVFYGGLHAGTYPGLDFSTDPFSKIENEDLGVNFTQATQAAACNNQTILVNC